MGLFFRDVTEGVLSIVAVYRGSDALDGVLSVVLGDRSPTLELSEVIKGSKHYDQVRVIVYESSPVVEIDSIILSEALGKPVLVVTGGSGFDELLMIRFKGIVVRPVGIDGASTERVLRTISFGSRIPAVDMAKKIAYSV